MISLSATKRSIQGKKVQRLREGGLLPAVFYGPTTDPASLSVARKEFEQVYSKAGESSLVELQIGEEKTPVLIRSVQRHPLSGEFTHIDFYQPRLDEKIKIMVPLHLEGEAPAVKELEGTLLQNIYEVEVSALPKDLPHEILADVSGLKTFEDRILVKDLPVGQGIEVLAEEDWIVAQVVPAVRVEEELAKPVEEEGAPEVEKVGEKEKEEEGEEQPSETPAQEQKE